MNEFCEIGKVIEIDGQKVIVEANQDSNDLTYFYNGIADGISHMILNHSSRIVFL